MDFGTILSLVFVLFFLVPVVQRRMLEWRRLRALRALEEARGTRVIALAADEIRMDAAAVLGPVDPQLGDLPAASIVRAAQRKPVERVEDRTLMLADVAEKALRHVKDVVRGLASRRLDASQADGIAEELAGGHYTHDDPITLEEARRIGLPVEVGIPREAYELMELFPQAGGRRPSVQYVPLPAPPPAGSRRAGRP